MILDYWWTADVLFILIFGTKSFRFLEVQCNFDPLLKALLLEIVFVSKPAKSTCCRRHTDGGACPGILVTPCMCGVCLQTPPY